MKRVCAILAACLLTVAVQAADSDWEKAVSLYKQGQFRAAITEFQKVVEEFPNYADSWKFIGLAHYHLKEYEPAVAPLEKAFELKRAEGKTDNEILLLLGTIHITLKHPEKALPYLETVTKQQPDASTNFYWLGLAYASLKRMDQAAAAFRTAVKLDPRDADSWYNLAASQLSVGKVDDAIIALRSAVIAAPKNAEMMSRLVELLLQRGGAETNEPKANAFYDEAIQVATKLRAARDDVASIELLGRVFLAAKKYTNAERTLAEALAATKEPTAPLYYNLGLAHTQNKAWPRAAEMLAQADRLNPGDMNTLYYLGFVYENLRKYVQALDAYTRAYEASGRSNADIKASIDRVAPFAKTQ